MWHGFTPAIAENEWELSDIGYIIYTVVLVPLCAHHLLQFYCSKNLCNNLWLCYHSPTDLVHKFTCGSLHARLKQINIGLDLQCLLVYSILWNLLVCHLNWPWSTTYWVLSLFLTARTVVTLETAGIVFAWWGSTISSRHETLERTKFRALEMMAGPRNLVLCCPVALERTRWPVFAVGL